MANPLSHGPNIYAWYNIPINFVNEKEGIENVKCEKEDEEKLQFVYKTNIACLQTTQKVQI